MQTTRRWHQQWRAQRRTKQCAPDSDTVDWLGTLSIWHNNKPVYTFYSSQQDTRLRSHRIKKAHGMLPSMYTMHTRRPDLYPDGLCRVCNLEIEDNEHIWQCTATEKERNTIWEDGLKKIHTWGRRAINAYNRARREQWEKRKEGPPPTPLMWYKPSIEACRYVLHQIIARPTMLNGGWSAISIFRGYVPRKLATLWRPWFRDTTAAVVTQVVRTFCRFIEEKGREILWKQRRDKTVE